MTIACRKRRVDGSLAKSLLQTHVKFNLMEKNVTKKKKKKKWLPKIFDTVFQLDWLNKGKQL